MNEQQSPESGESSFNAAEALRRHAESFDIDQPEAHERQAAATKIHLIKVEHTPSGNPARVAEAVGSARVLGVEYLGGTHQQRQDRARQISEVLASANSPDAIARLEAATSQPWLRSMLTPLIGSGIELEFLDVSSEDPEIRAVRDTIEEARQLGQAFEQPLSPAKHYGMLSRYYDLESASSVERDELVATQVEAMAERHRGKEIAVVVGRGHDPLLEEVVEPGALSETIVAEGHDPAEMSIDEEAVRTRVQSPEKPLSKELILRAMLERYYNIAYARTHQLTNLSQAQVIEHGSRPARAVPDELLVERIAAARYAIYGDNDRYQEKLLVGA